MSKLFANIELKSTDIALQQKNKQGQIVKKSKGRPKKENMVKRTIKVDVVTYGQVVDYVNRVEHTTIAAFITRALRNELKKARD